MRLLPGEEVRRETVRFRTLGCYPLSGAVRSEARTIPEIIRELLVARDSERRGRLIDHDADGSMEQKKREGYF
jgi:sulfate adenylyltransferase subunit 2